MRYYIPVNKLLIECTAEMFIHFKPVTYNQNSNLILFGRSSMQSGNMQSLCFAVIGIDPTRCSKCFHTYEEAYDFFQLKTNEVLLTSK